MDALHFVRRLDEVLQRVLKRGMGTEGLAPARTDIESEETDPDTQRLARLTEMVDESYRFAEELAAGRLESQVSRGNVLAMPLKAFQASLRHLTWQAGQVADGDLSQQVHFLGEFSESFNRMIASLRDKAVLEQRLQTVTDVLGEGVLLVDRDGNLQFMNPEVEHLLEYDEDELRMRPVHETIHIQCEDGTRLGDGNSLLGRAILEGEEYRNNDDVFTCKSGRLLPVSVVCRPVVSDGENSGAVIAFGDITEQKRYRESLEHINRILERQASTDALTGIYNRMRFSKLLDVELNRSRRYGTPLAVILLDIDKFKSVNDTYGHLAGDNVLKALALLLTGSIRSSDVVARWGGEEFIVMAPGCGLQEGAALAEKLRAAVAEHDFPLPRPVTSSFGVATFVEDDTELTLTNRADQALYVAKESGRNRVEMEAV